MADVGAILTRKTSVPYAKPDEVQKATCTGTLDFGHLYGNENTITKMDLRDGAINSITYLLAKDQVRNGVVGMK
jgi:hypothetical protein